MRRILHVSFMGLIVAGTLPLAANAAVVPLRVNVENLAPANSVSFAPLRIGFGNGTFDSFNAGQTATAPIISIAEGGSGSDWFPAFGSAEPAALLGTVVPNPAGPLLPGQTGSAEFTIDTSVNRYFTFAAMAVPSNDYFIGNDSPTQYPLFDMDGNLLISEINQAARDIWDAGSEVDDPANAAFVVVGTNSNRIADTDVVGFDFQGLSIFNGLTTAAGYQFNLNLTDSSPVYRISFEVVPEPTSAALLALGALAIVRRRR